jgi:hypothetical protein|tara:strand:+ start:165 stop:554 length:390 start_codon:yes stop_codon:yes gene_type:complete
MANHTGVSGVVKVGSNVVAELRSFTIDTTAELIEDTTLTDTSRTYQFGKKGATVSAECWWDETDTNGQIAIIEGSQVALNLYPEGADSGDYYFSGTWLIGSNSISIPTDGIIEASFNATLTGALTRGTV